MCRKFETGKESKEYGVNRNSILIELIYFHVCDSSLLPDVMHNILEGALQYEVKLLLKRMVNCEKYFTLKTFNFRLENLDLGYINIKNQLISVNAKQMNSDGTCNCILQSWYIAINGVVTCLLCFLYVDGYLQCSTCMTPVVLIPLWYKNLLTTVP